MKKQPILITDAARSPDDEFRSRQIRYVSMMSIRAVCLILGAVLISVRPPLLPLWLILCAAGMVFLPWAAVLIANDRPARSKAERAASERAQRQQAALEQHSAADGGSARSRAAEGWLDGEYLVIDVDPLDATEHRREKG